jgi:hypothetical protein
MDTISQREPRALWSFWVACGLAATGGIVPLVLAGGGPNRLAGAAIPFGVAAAALAACALTYQRGRPLATALYFLAGIALVYGMLSMVAVPLRLAVLGTCDPLPAVCPPGSERPFTSGEGAGFAFGIAMGTLAILVGFFGLLMLFRIHPQIAPPPPTRRESPWVPPGEPVVTPKPAPAEAKPDTAAPAVAETAAPPETGTATPAVSTVPAAAAPAPRPKRARKPSAKPESKPQPELAAPASPLELEAPEPQLELPPPASTEEPGSGEPSSS